MVYSKAKAILILLMLNGCASGPVPKVNVKSWAGDSKNVSITRSQDPDRISCSDPRFDNYACLSYQDIQALYDALQSCQGFVQGTPLMSPKEKKEFYIDNQPVIDRLGL